MGPKEIFQTQHNTPWDEVVNYTMRRITQYTISVASTPGVKGPQVFSFTEWQIWAMAVRSDFCGESNKLCLFS